MTHRIQVFDDRYAVHCSACGQSEHIEGRFVTGLETPRSVQRALQHHWQTSALFPTHRPCEARDRWSTGPWEVLDANAQVVASGQCTITRDGPSVEAGIDQDIDGLDWNARRIKQLAAAEITDSIFKDRRWHVSAGEHPNVVLETQSGRSAIIPISHEELDVERATDDEIRAKIRAHLNRLRMSEHEGNA